MSVAYANAREVLSRELLKGVQARFEGCLMWVSPRETRRRKSRRKEERIRQIIKEAQAKS